MKLFTALLCAFVLTGCTTRTEYGDCIGIDGVGKPDLVYKMSVVNAVIGVIFIETIIVPIMVLKDQTYCPVEKVK